MAILRLPSIPISSKDGFTQRSVITEWRKGCEALINSFTSITEFFIPDLPPSDLFADDFTYRHASS